MKNVERKNLPSQEEVEGLKKAMGGDLLISIVLPTCNTNALFLKDCLNSVLSQSWPFWELCIADDASTSDETKTILKEYAEKDSRIKIIFREENGHISRASNSALSLATGKFVALLDHDDVLAKHALFFVVKEIQKKPETQIIYSDEDKIDERGRRHSPHFKSDWNPDLFFSQNYVSHLGVYRLDILKKIGGFRTGVEGSQDQDLLLRCLPHVKAENIRHIAHVLYHWRATKGSTALTPGEKNYTTEAGVKALHDYFVENGPHGIYVEEGMLPNTYRVRWPVPAPLPLVSLLIPTRDSKKITEQAVFSILEKTAYQNYEIIILDNGSVERDTLNWFSEIQRLDERVRVVRYDFPFNYSAINNFGVKHAKGSIIGLLNNDVEVISSGWLGSMVAHVCREDIGCVGAKLYFPDDTLQHAGVILSIGGVAGHSHKFFPKNSTGYFSRLMVDQNLSAVTGACLLVRKTVYQEVGGLDELNLKIAFNDVDFCLKVREAGYRNLWTPYAELYHHESVSRGQEDTPEKIKRFNSEVNFMKSKWGDLLNYDPYYNLNLTKNHENFSLEL